MTGGADPPGSPAWLRAEEQRLLAFARAARRPGGFAELDRRGRQEAGRPVQTYVTARMTHVFALADILGDASAGALADSGVAALRGPLRDPDHGGWFPAEPDGGPADKRAYDHAFVLLAAATASGAGRAGAAELLAEAAACVERRFWREEEGASLETWDRGWSRPEPYRGANANMHMVEAFLAVADATGNQVWLERALRVADRLVHGAAREHGWRLPEHYDASWRVVPGYHAEDPAHPFRPFGATVGHWLEWARLLLHLRAGLPDPPPWLLADARALFAAAVAQGWAVDGAAGFVYTVGWDGRPVVRARMHWVLAEALGAAAVLHRVTAEESYAGWQARWWDYAERHLLDRVDGSWHHELDEHNRPAATVWTGKPDVYHAYQAALLPRLPVAPSLGGAARRVRDRSGVACAP
jgi:sulfoquinovose isomerase